jgi:hypothetical protein
MTEVKLKAHERTGVQLHYLNNSIGFQEAGSAMIKYIVTKCDDISVRPCVT